MVDNQILLLLLVLILALTASNLAVSLYLHKLRWRNRRRLPDVPSHSGQEATGQATGQEATFEILDSQGNVLYTRPAGHPDWQEAYDTPGLYIREQDQTVVAGHQGKPK